MGQLFLLLALLSSLSIVVLLRAAEKGKVDRYVMIGSNYLVAGSLGFLFLQKTEAPSVEVLVFGAVIGLLFFVSFSFFSFSLKKSGIASTVTFGRLSLAIPVTASILLWGESPSFSDVISLAIIFLIILLWEKRIRNLSPTLFILFLLFGAIDASLKYFKIRFPGTDHNIFLITLFYSALVWSWLYILFSRRRIRIPHILTGLALGVPNFFSSFFVLLALSGGVPAYVTFPFINIGVILSSAILGKVLFGENLSTKRIILIGLGITAIILLTI